MLSFVKIIFKNFLNNRKKRRSLSLVLSGSFLLIFLIISIYNTILINIGEYWGKMLLGQGAIVASDYENYKVFSPAKKKYYYSYNKLKPYLSQQNNMNYSERLRISCLLENTNDEIKHPMELIGCNFDREMRILKNIEIIEGRYPGKNSNEICLFFDAAGKLNLETGDSLVVYVKNVDGYLDYDLLVLSGILAPVKTQYFYGAENVGFVPLSFAETIKAVDSDVVSEVIFAGENSLWGNDPGNLPASFKVVDMLDSEELPVTLSWLYKYLIWIMIILIFGVVFSCIYHNTYLMISERYKELSVLLSFGATRFWIMKWWFSEYTVYIIYCSVIGALTATLLIWGINSINIYAPDVVTEILLCSDKLNISLTGSNYFYSFLIIWGIVISGISIPFYKGVNEAIIIKLVNK